ncbi:hypothetical protein JOF28_000095 [Leucobacter exalbidus]|uniref:FUSC family protein n=1 Tax=Leucobacter exalbidus TaxID=662960 RepID=A0A940PKS7_9MICO|nr:hypothetical protein [Leucobacter exalbidus]MBP1324863.1 hypothetical protein [Leucobacter exalbidus]
MDARTRIAALVAARDPAHTRFLLALAVSAGVGASVLTASLLLRGHPAQTSFLAVPLFLSAIAGSMAQDRTAIARFTTTVLMIPSVVIIVLVAVTLSQSRIAVTIAFILVVGAAVWVRRFGPRAGAIGSLCFMGFFFTLIMQVTAKDLLLFCTISAIAIAAQALMRAILLLKRPRRELTVLLRELRVASASAIHGSRHPQRAKNRRAELARIDEVARSISAWQQNVRTDHEIGCDEHTLDALVLEARVSTEEACAAIARAGHAAPSDSADAHGDQGQNQGQQHQHHALPHLLPEVKPHSDPQQLLRHAIG